MTRREPRDRLTHSAHQRGDRVIRQSLVTSNSILNIGDLEVDIVELLLLVVCQGGDEVVDTWDKNLSLRRDELRH
jgi:hypothetical protein